MNARRFDHYLDFCACLRGFQTETGKTQHRSQPRVSRAKATLRRLLKKAHRAA